MKNYKGSSSIVALVVVGLIVLGAVGYLVMNRSIAPAPAAEEMVAKVADPVFAWELSEAPEVEGIPQTMVALSVNGVVHPVGTYAGSCAQIGESGGIDSKGLLAGELSAVQCWFAGGGDEIGVFAVEDGTFEVLEGALDEGTEGSGMFRGDFKGRTDIKI